MEQRMITTYCLIAEFMKSKSSKKEYKLLEISEVLFLRYLAVSDFNGNHKKAHYYGMRMKLIRKIE